MEQPLLLSFTILRYLTVPLECRNGYANGIGARTFRRVEVQCNLIRMVGMVSIYIAQWRQRTDVAVKSVAYGTKLLPVINKQLLPIKPLSGLQIIKQTNFGFRPCNGVCFVIKVHSRCPEHSESVAVFGKIPTIMCGKTANIINGLCQII